MEWDELVGCLDEGVVVVDVYDVIGDEFSMM